MDAKPMKILIIEDDINECNNFINCAKKREDIELVEKTDSDIEALKIVKVKHPEGIILDLELNNSIDGNIDSFEFLSNLRNMNLNYEPIIIVTTHVNSKRTYEILHREGVELILYKEHPNYSCDLVFNKFINLRKISPTKTVKELKEEIEGTESRIFECISQELDLIGIPSKLSGRKYLHDAIFYLVNNEDESENVFRYLAEKHKKPANTITNVMRNAINHAWDNSPVEDLLKHYTAKINLKTGVPTAGEFIYYYRDKVKRKI